MNRSVGEVRLASQFQMLPSLAELGGHLSLEQPQVEPALPQVVAEGQEFFWVSGRERFLSSQVDMATWQRGDACAGIGATRCMNVAARRCRSGGKGESYSSGPGESSVKGCAARRAGERSRTERFLRERLVDPQLAWMIMGGSLQGQVEH